MRLWQMRNDADNAHIRAYMRKYVQKFANICCNADMRIDLHRCASEKSGAWPSLIHTQLMSYYNTGTGYLVSSSAD